jgi:hypothetical protein
MTAPQSAAGTHHAGLRVNTACVALAQLWTEAAVFVGGSLIAGPRGTAVEVRSSGNWRRPRRPERHRAAREMPLLADRSGAFTGSATAKPSERGRATSGVSGSRRRVRHVSPGARRHPARWLRTPRLRTPRPAAPRISTMFRDRRHCETVAHRVLRTNSCADADSRRLSSGFGRRGQRAGGIPCRRALGRRDGDPMPCPERRASITRSWSSTRGIQTHGGLRGRGRHGGDRRTDPARKGNISGPLG